MNGTSSIAFTPTQETEAFEALEEMIDAANAPGQEVPAPPAKLATLSAHATGGDAAVARLFEAIKVERGGDGSLRIEAPPAAAGALASLFDGMARLLAAVAAPPPTEPEQHPPSLPS
jgi:hypothetical protein